MEALNVRMKDLHRDELNVYGFDWCHPYVIIGTVVSCAVFAFSAMMLLFGKHK